MSSQLKRKLAALVETPLCQHFEPCIERCVRGGKNVGRKFFVCSRPMNNRWKCNFFMWKDDFDPLEYQAPDYPKIPEPPQERWTVEKFLSQFDGETEEDRRIVASASQRTNEWLQARKWRITASVFGSAAGYNPYQSPEDLVRQKLWQIFVGNDATRYGNEHEPMALEAYIKMREDQGDSVTVEEHGLQICEDNPKLAVSPDGVVVETLKDGTIKKYLLEIKCPFKHRQRSSDCQDPFYPCIDLPNGSKGEITKEYFCQIQGMMGILGFEYCDFFVWCPQGFKCIRFYYDEVFWKSKLLPALNKFYDTMLAPYAVRYLNGELRPQDL